LVLKHLPPCAAQSACDVWTTLLWAKSLTQHQQVGCDLAKAAVATASTSAIIINAPALSLEIVEFEVFMS
jgi:hypothetical protein